MRREGEVLSVHVPGSHADRWEGASSSLPVSYITAWMEGAIENLLLPRTPNMHKRTQVSIMKKRIGIEGERAPPAHVTVMRENMFGADICPFLDRICSSASHFKFARPHVVRRSSSSFHNHTPSARSTHCSLRLPKSILTTLQTSHM
jgi:hypothetical protein